MSAVNDRWAHIILATCVAQGVHAFLLCPGARSTPMAVALYNLKVAGQLRVFTHYDERGAAFYALGIAKATGKPVAIITTSGTAVANILPALVEAKKSQTSLIVISCDRPPEAIYSGANQTISQGELLSSAVAYSHTLPVPTSDISENQIAYTVAHAVAIAISDFQPIHLNCPFREPLSENPTTGIASVSPQIVVGKKTIDLPETVIIQLRNAKRGVILAGGNADASQLLALAKAYNWPILPDVCSPLRYVADETIITFTDLLAGQNALDASDCILHLGNPMTGRNIPDWVQKQSGSYIRIHHRDDYGDPICRANYIGIGETPFAELLALTVQPSQFTNPKRGSENECLEKALDLPPISETALFHHWDSWLPEGWALFLGNSQPIRQISEVAAASTRPMMAIGYNRGASGIDGLIATAGGFMTGHDRPGVLILGDLSFLHDVSSLPLVAHQPLLILVIQNNGGEIFSRFSVKDHPCFTDFFHLTHTHSCAEAGNWALGYSKRVEIGNAVAAIHAATAWMQDSGHAALLEIVVNQN